MKRATFAFALTVLLVVLLAPVSEAQRTKKKTSTGKKSAVPCPKTLNSIDDCQDTGCGLDPNLNKQENMRSLDGEAEPMTVQQIRKLPDPVPGFKIGDTREKLEALGEGKKIVVVANALMVRKGGSESCNCKLTSVADTDNRIVLVDRVLRIKPGETSAVTPQDKPAQRQAREPQALSAEYHKDGSNSYCGQVFSSFGSWSESIAKGKRDGR